MKTFDFKNWLENEDGYPPIEWYKTPLPQNLRAYHGGSKFEKFSLDHLGSGEYAGSRQMMFPALGFGIYFSDCKEIAAKYTKFSKDPAIHEVVLDTSNLYDIRNGNPRLNQALENILEELNKSREDSPFRTFGMYEGLFRMFDKNQAIKLLTKHGIDGAFTRLPSGCYEISVINPDIIKRTDL
jgi:hypothetical protein